MRKKLAKKNRFKKKQFKMFQPATRAVIALTLCATIYPMSQQNVAAQGFLERSAIANYLPDSLRIEYPAPMLADDDVLFAIDSTGKSLYMNFASNKSHSVIVVVDPARAKDSALVWVSEPLLGHLDYFYVADINADASEEIVVSCRKLDPNGWNRLYIWRWPSDANPDSVVALAPCSDTVNSYFQGSTRVEVIDTGAVPDGVSEIVVNSVLSDGLVGRESTAIRTTYYWTGEEYCVKR